jgi:hypothetical protein
MANVSVASTAAMQSRKHDFHGGASDQRNLGRDGPVPSSTVVLASTTTKSSRRVMKSPTAYWSCFCCRNKIGVKHVPQAKTTLAARPKKWKHAARKFEARTTRWRKSGGEKVYRGLAFREQIPQRQVCPGIGFGNRPRPGRTLFPGRSTHAKSAPAARQASILGDGNHGRGWHSCWSREWS